MKIIAEITDKEIIGTDGLSSTEPRYTARAIVKNGDLYAVIHSEKFHPYSLPGGGVDDGEDIVTALKKDLQKQGYNDILIHSNNSYAVDVELLRCDYYRYLTGNADSADCYKGEFMKQYSWAEEYIYALRIIRRQFYEKENYCNNRNCSSYCSSLHNKTDYLANSSTIEVRFGGAGFIRKTLGVTDNSGNKTEYSENAEQEVKGKTVTLKGKDGKYYLATWNYNNFAYTISLDENTGGVSAEEMTEYIEATY